MSPLSRFEKLDPAKQAAILDAATAEFVANGFDGASLNRIIAAAGISKGAMYYYFEDKLDLFVTAVRRYDPGDVHTRRHLADVPTAEAFWSAMDGLFETMIAYSAENPDLIGLGRAFFDIPKEQWSQGQLGSYMGEKMAELTFIFETGQRVTAVRDDLPMPILHQLWIAMDEVLERWILAEWDQLDASSRRARFDLMLSIFKATFRPPKDAHDPA